MYVENRDRTPTVCLLLLDSAVTHDRKVAGQRIPRRLGLPPTFVVTPLRSDQLEQFIATSPHLRARVALDIEAKQWLRIR